MSGQTWPRVNRTGTRAQGAETKVAGKAPRGPGGAPSACARSQGSQRPQLCPGDVTSSSAHWASGNADVRTAERCSPNRHSAFLKGASSDVGRAQPSVGPACRFTVPLREDEAPRGKRLPEDTGSRREPTATHGSIDSVAATCPGDSDPVP